MFGNRAGWLGGLLLTVLVTLVTACVASGPEQALREFWEATARQDTSRVMTLMHNPEIEKLTENAPPEEAREYEKMTVASFFDDMENVDIDDMSIRVKGSRRRADTAWVRYTFEGSSNEDGPVSLGQQTVTARLISIDGTWRVATADAEE